MLAHSYVITEVQVGLPTVPNCLGHPEFWVILSSSPVFQSQPFLCVSVKREKSVICALATGASQLHLTPQAFVTPTRTGETCSERSSCLPIKSKEARPHTHTTTSIINISYIID